MRSKFCKISLFFISFNLFAFELTRPISLSHPEYPTFSDIEAQKIAVVNAKTLDIIFEKDINELHIPASLTKLMTMFIVFDYIESNILSLDQKFRIPPSFAEIPLVKGSVVLGLEVGDIVSIEELCAATIIASANDAANMLALIIGGSIESFAAYMNEYAALLSLEQTVYADPAGLSNKNTTSLYDLMKLTKNMMDQFGVLYKRFSQQASFLWKSKTITSTNLLISNRVRGVYGIKTGYLEDAGFNFLVGIEKEGIDVFIGLLGVESRTYSAGIKKRAAEAEKLIDYLFNNFSEIPALHDEVRIFGGEYETLAYNIDSKFIIPQEWLSDIDIVIEENEIWAPLDNDKILGSFTIRYKEAILTEGTIVNNKGIVRRKLLATMIDRFVNFFRPNRTQNQVLRLSTESGL